MKITQKELKEMIREAVAKKIALKEGNNDFEAKRKIIHKAQEVSMEFEKEIISLLGLMPPGEYNSKEHLEAYYNVVKTFETEFVNAVTKVVHQLAKFPRTNKGGKKNV
jgi:hypothetical protein